MTSIVERYDRDAHLYDAHWQVVLDAPARRLLDRLEPAVGRASGRPGIVDIGTGSGVLAVEAARRWPGASVLGVDPSEGMLAMARRRAASADLTDPARLRWARAPAERLPLPNGSVDLAVSSFVLQLVPERPPVLAEVLRVLRPGGRLGYVTWLDRGPDFAPDAEFDEAVLDCGIEEPEAPEPEPPRAGDVPSLRAAERELRAAGFRSVSVRHEVLVHAWTAERYLDFKRSYDEQALYALLDEPTAARLEARVRERWASLPEAAFVFRAELVSALAARP